MLGICTLDFTTNALLCGNQDNARNIPKICTNGPNTDKNMLPNQPTLAMLFRDLNLMLAPKLPRRNALIVEKHHPLIYPSCPQDDSS